MVAARILILFCFQIAYGFIINGKRNVLKSLYCVIADARPNHSYRWDRHWYPIHIVEDIEVDKPTKVTLLERDYVLWKQSGSNEITAFLDQCPHRLVPLSEGRIEKSRNSLQCAYHGWEFDVQGACTKIPQMGNDAAAKSRACLTQIPISIKQGLVFLWPDTSDDGRMLASLSTPAVSSGLDNCTPFDIATTIRDLPYGYDTLLENIVDPSHVPFAHHGINVNRNNIQTSDSWKLLRNDMNEIIMQILPNLNLHFVPPTQVSSIYGAFYAIPVAPGHSRIIVQILKVRREKGLSAIAKTIQPRWYFHATTQNAV